MGHKGLQDATRGVIWDTQLGNVDVFMSHPVKLSDDLIDEARRYASLNSRSVPKQIEYWSRIGKIVEDNPDLSYAFIKQLLLSKRELGDDELTDYRFGPI